LGGAQLLSGPNAGVLTLRPGQFLEPRLAERFGARIGGQYHWQGAMGLDNSAIVVGIDPPPLWQWHAKDRIRVIVG